MPRGSTTSRATHGEFTQENDDTQAPAQKKKKKRTGPDYRTATGARRLQSSDPNARGEYRDYANKIDPDATAKYIPKLQKHLKTLPGGEAMARKVAGWGVFHDGNKCTNYVDRDARKCYRSMSKVEDALKA